MGSWMQLIRKRGMDRDSDVCMGDGVMDGKIPFIWLANELIWKHDTKRRLKQDTFSRPE